MSNPIVDPMVEVPDSDATSPLVRLEATVEGAVTVVLNRPDKKNALNANLIATLDEAFHTLKGAEGVRVVFLRGAGGMFCAGADLEQMRGAIDYSEAENREDAMQLAKMLKALWDIPALTVALVEGGAYAGGAGLVAACDMAIATHDAKFSFTEARLGLIPAMISPYVIEALGPRTTRALFATARVFDAAYAEKVGLVDQVVADAAALNAAQAKLAKEMIACAPGAIADCKALVDAVAGKTIDHGLMEDTARRIAAARVGAEGQEGLQAFFARRKPSWAQEG